MSLGDTVEGCSGGGANSFAGRGGITDGKGGVGIGESGADGIGRGMGWGTSITGAPGAG